MKIVLASSNKGKIKEIQKLLPTFEVVTYSDILGSFEIVEDGKTFQENAIIKVKEVSKKLKEIDYEKCIVISDDSGLTIPLLNNEPNIYSARYARIDATDQENIQKVITKLKEKKVTKTEAHYTACIAISYNDNIYTTHGWMYGSVIDTQKGDRGFGYDPIFIPNGYDTTLGVLDDEVKKKDGHRSKALYLAMKIINRFKIKS